MVDLPDTGRVELAIIEQTDAFRKEQGLARLDANAELTATARAFAQFLAKSGKFAHEADGRQPADRAKASGYKFCTIAENLSMRMDSRGFKTEALAHEAVEGWKASPGHRKNMLLANVVEIGVGVARAPDGHPKYLSVQLLGRPERLRTSFRVENKATVAVKYTYFGKSHTIEPRGVAAHSTCATGKISFDRAGNWLTGTNLNSQFEAKDGAIYALTTGGDGRVRIDIQAKKGR